MADKNIYVSRPKADAGTNNSMKKNAKEKSGLPYRFALITTILMVVLTVTFIVLLSSLLSYLLRTSDSYHEEPRSFYYYVENGKYVDAVAAKNRNEAGGYTVQSNKEYKEYYALADYFYAASLYKVYSAGGDPRAEEALKTMEESAALVGDLQFAIEDVNSILK